MHILNWLVQRERSRDTRAALRPRLALTDIVIDDVHFREDDSKGNHRQEDPAIGGKGDERLVQWERSRDTRAALRSCLALTDIVIDDVYFREDNSKGNHSQEDPAVGGKGDERGNRENGKTDLE
uniref:Transposase n=1 Tax=Steinernema glaseri TaxID=37863 RepID=A0A1I8A7H1_9BILA